MGDRYELLGISLVNIFYNKKIIHLHGGEETLGTYDNITRKIFSLISNIHLVSHNNYKRNIEKLIGSKKNVFNFGSVAAEKISRLKLNKKNLLSKNELKDKFGLNFNNKIIIIT